MTKTEFLNGKRFTFDKSRREGDTTYYFTLENSQEHLYDKHGRIRGFISEELRHTTTDKVLVDNHHCNIKHLGDDVVETFTILLDVEVETTVAYKDMYPID